MNLALEVRIRFDDVDAAINMQTANVSREGLFIAMDPPKPIGTRVRVRVQIANTSEKFALECVVVRTVPDLDDLKPLAPGETKGVGVFLTATSAGWTRFCDELSKRRQTMLPRSEPPKPREGSGS